MKARIDKYGNIITYEEIPHYWGNYAGGFDKQSDDVHKQFGFYSVEEPEYNPKKQRLGNLSFDEAKEMFVWEVIPIEHNLDDIKKNLKEELKSVVQEVSQLILEIKNIYNPLDITPENLPNDFKLTAQEIAPLRSNILIDINALDNIDDALDFVVRTEEIEGLIQDLKSFL